MTGPLGYLFWHAPRDGVPAAAYEGAARRWQEALAAHPAPGFRGGVTWRLPAPPWLTGWPPTVYADLYVVEDYAALGVLGDDAVTGALRTPHDAAARLAGHGTAGLYRRRSGPPGADPATADGEPVLSWHDKPPGVTYPEVLATLAGTGRSVWLRQLTLGPGPELLVVVTGPAPDDPAWSAPAARL